MPWLSSWPIEAAVFAQRQGRAARWLHRSLEDGAKKAGGRLEENLSGATLAMRLEAPHDDLTGRALSDPLKFLWSRASQGPQPAAIGPHTDDAAGLSISPSTAAATIDERTS